MIRVGQRVVVRVQDWETGKVRRVWEGTLVDQRPSSLGFKQTECQIEQDDGNRVWVLSGLVRPAEGKE